MTERDRRKIANNWSERRFSCDLWTDPPGQRWEDFRHATDELVLVLEGDVEFEIADDLHYPKVGKGRIIPPNATDSARISGTIALGEGSDGMSRHRFSPRRRGALGG